jgi:hypothetical protein
MSGPSRGSGEKPAWTLFCGTHAPSAPNVS